jgi:hypothetical protein
MRGGLKTPVDGWNGQDEQSVIVQRQPNTVIPSLRPQAIRLSRLRADSNVHDNDELKAGQSPSSPCSGNVPARAEEGSEGMSSGCKSQPAIHVVRVIRVLL